MRDRDAIARLKYEYCYSMDTQDADAFVDLFTADAEFDVTDVMAGSGHDDLAEFIATLQSWNTETMAHMVANPLIEITGDRATGTWYYVVFIEHEDGQLEFGQGRYDETYRRVDGEWRIETLDVTRRFTTEI